MGMAYKVNIILGIDSRYMLTSKLLDSMNLHFHFITTHPPGSSPHLPQFVVPHLPQFVVPVPTKPMQCMTSG